MVRTQVFLSLVGGAAALSASARGSLDKAVATLEQMASSLDEERHEAKKVNTEQNEAYTGSITNSENELGHCKKLHSEGEADLAKGTSNKEQSEAVISESDYGITTLTKDVDVMTKENKKQMTDYATAISELEEASAAVGRATQAVMAGAAADEVEEEEALIQIAAPYPKAQAKLMSLLQQEPEEGTDVQSTDYAEINTGRNDVLMGILKDVSDQIDGDLQAKVEDKAEALKLFEITYQQIAGENGEITAHKSNKEQHQTLLNEAESLIADATGAITQNKACMEESQTAIDQATQEQEATNQAYNNLDTELANQQAAVASAVSLLNNYAGGSDQSVSFLQRRAVSLMALKSVNSHTSKIVSFLTTRAKALNSSLLKNLASSMVGDNVFERVAQQIEQMITKLKEDSLKEQKAKGFCDNELAKHKRNTEKNDRGLATSNADVEELTAALEKLSGEASELSSFLAELAETRQQLTGTREENNQINTDAIKENTEAKLAIDNARTILGDKFGASDTETAQSSFVKIDTLLEQAGNDCVTAKEHFEKTEDEQAGTFRESMGNLEEQNAVAETDLRHTDREIAEKSTAKKESEHASHEGEKTKLSLEQVYAGLKPQCVDSGVSYKERVARREQEVQSLKDALEILEANQI